MADLTNPGIDQYPQSARDGQAFPFDIGNPYGTMIAATTTTSGGTAIALPAEGLTLSILSTVRAVMSYGGEDVDLTVNLFVEDQILLPKLTLVQAFVRGSSIKFKSISATGVIYIQAWRPWQSGGVEQLKQNY